jgi:hypothetical protein
VPFRVNADFKPSRLANSAYPKPLGFISSLSSMIRTFVHSHPVKKSVTSPTVASNERLPRWTVYGGLSGSGSSSRTE